MKESLLLFMYENDLILPRQVQEEADLLSHICESFPEYHCIWQLADSHLFS